MLGCCVKFDELAMAWAAHLLESTLTSRSFFSLASMLPMRGNKLAVAWAAHLLGSTLTKQYFFSLAPMSPMGGNVEGSVAKAPACSTCILVANKCCQG